MARSAKSLFGVRLTSPDTGTIPRLRERSCGTAGSIVVIWLGAMLMDTSGSRAARRTSSFARASTYLYRRWRRRFTITPRCSGLA